MNPGQIGWLLWWPMNRCYYMKCDRCKRGNDSWWQRNNAGVYALYLSDLGNYRAVCSCAKILKQGEVDLLSPFSVQCGENLPSPTDFLQDNFNPGRQ